MTVFVFDVVKNDDQVDGEKKAFFSMARAWAYVLLTVRVMYGSGPRTPLCCRIHRPTYANCHRNGKKKRPLTFTRRDRKNSSATQFRSMQIMTLSRFCHHLIFFVTPFWQGALLSLLKENPRQSYESFLGAYEFLKFHGKTLLFLYTVGYMSSIIQYKCRWFL